MTPQTPITPVLWGLLGISRKSLPHWSFLPVVRIREDRRNRFIVTRRTAILEGDTTVLRAMLVALTDPRLDYHLPHH